MKRSDLPKLAFTTTPDGKSRYPMVNGSAAAVHLGAVVDFPDGLPDQKWAGPLIAFVFPARLVNEIPWETLRKIADAETAEKAAVVP